jgi:hypothetical protein
MAAFSAQIKAKNQNIIVLTVTEMAIKRKGFPPPKIHTFIYIT